MLVRRSPGRPRTAVSGDQSHSESKERTPTPRIPASHLQALCSLLGTLLYSSHAVSPRALQRALPTHPQVRVRCSPMAQPPSPSAGWPRGGKGEDAHPAFVGQKKDTRPVPPCVSSPAAPPPRGGGEAETSLMSGGPASDFSQSSH